MNAAPPDHALARALDGLYLGCIWTAGIAITLMSLIVPVGVVMRYVFGFGAQWPEPIAILLMMVFTFVGAAAAYRAGGHIAVGMLVDRLPPALQRALAVLVHLLMAVVCLFVVVYGTRLCAETLGQSVAELPWLPVGVTYQSHVVSTGVYTPGTALWTIPALAAGGGSLLRAVTKPA